MSVKQLLTIGEFSKLMQVTVKTLRHYEQKGLLSPQRVDEWTGYRYYGIEQMQRMNDILDLKRLGFSLEEIKDLYDDKSHVPDLDLLSAKIRETESLLRTLVQRRDQLQQWRDSRKKLTQWKNSPSNRCPKSSWPAIAKSSPTMPLSVLCAMRR